MGYMVSVFRHDDWLFSKSGVQYGLAPSGRIVSASAVISKENKKSGGFS